MTLPHLLCILATILLGRANAEQIRLVAFDGSTGTGDYSQGQGSRLLKAIKPDIAFLQTFKTGNNTSDIGLFVTDTFGGDFTCFRGNVSSNADIPNAIVSRFPILSSGEWVDSTVSGRTFVWACLDIPGSKNLWAVSIHLSTALASRNSAAVTLVQQITAAVPAGDYLAIGGNFNANDRAETQFTTLSSVVVTNGPYPVDQAGNANTNPVRTRPYDSLLVNSGFNSLLTPVVFGGGSFPAGLVLDPRVFTPASAFSPATVEDASAFNHFPVIKDFIIPSTPFQITSSSHSTVPTPSETITFNSVAGRSYRVQASATLLAGDWSTLGSIQASAASTTITIVPSAPGAGQLTDPQLSVSARRFYRIATP